MCLSSFSLHRSSLWHGGRKRTGRSFATGKTVMILVRRFLDRWRAAGDSCARIIRGKSSADPCGRLFLCDSISDRSPIRWIPLGHPARVDCCLRPQELIELRVLTEEPVAERQCIRAIVRSGAKTFGIRISPNVDDPTLAGVGVGLGRGDACIPLHTIRCRSCFLGTPVSRSSRAA